MESKFNENGVITGIADSFCLSCQKYLKLNDVIEHISESDHHKTFKLTNYVEKYKTDRIRKVKLGYYCEICNVMIQTLAKTGIHINEVTHISNKNGQQLKESDAGVVAFDDILIENNAWHGLADGSCLICNVDYSDDDDHKNEPTHILKLIQSKFELKKYKYVYRKIDAESINCLICNTIIMEQSKEIHFNEIEHKNNYIKRQRDKNNNTKTNVTSETDLEKKITSNEVINKQTESKKDKNKTKKSTTYVKTDNDLVKNSSSEDDISKPTDSKDDSQETDSKDDLNSETQIAVYNTDEEIEKVENKDDDEIVTPIEALQMAKKFAKLNHLNYKRNSTYCRVCDVRISSTLKMMKEHVAESSHIVKAAKRTVRKMNKVPMNDFVNSCLFAKSFFCHDVIINDKICIEVLSFCMVSINRGMLRCQACEVSLPLDGVDLHKITSKHAYAMEHTPVITDFESELVREVRPKVYHCGYCNFVEAGLENLKNHLKSINHLQKKSEAKQRLATHMPAITAHKEERQMFDFMKMFFQHI